jgi:hypothetical protein
LNAKKIPATRIPAAFNAAMNREGGHVKKLVFLFVFVSLLAAPVLAAEQAIVLKVKVQVANVRAEPDMNSTVVKKIPADTLLEARQRIGDWYEITVTDASGAAISGYIHQQVVDVVAGAPREPEPVREEPRRPVREPVREEPRQPVERRMAPVSYGSGYGMGGFKVIGGLAMASLRYPTEETAEFDKYKKSKMGLAGGIGFDSGGQFGFGMNVLYIQKGVKYSGEETKAVKFNAPVSIDHDQPSLHGQDPIHARFDAVCLGRGRSGLCSFGEVEMDGHGY